MRDGDGRHGEGAGRSQRMGAGRKCGARGHDVVHEDDPAVGDGRPGGGRDLERVSHVSAPLGSVERELAGGRPPPAERCHDGQAEFRGDDPGDQLCLVVAALAPSVAMNGYGDQEFTATPGPPPASRHELPERPGQALFAAVLEGVDRPAQQRVVRRHPLHLDERWRQLAGDADRDAGLPLDVRGEAREAAPADRFAFGATARADCGEREVQGSINRPCEEVRLRSVAPGAYPARIRRGASP